MTAGTAEPPTAGLRGAGLRTVLLVLTGVAAVAVGAVSALLPQLFELEVDLSPAGLAALAAAAALAVAVLRRPDFGLLVLVVLLQLNLSEVLVRHHGLPSLLQLLALPLLAAGLLTRVRGGGDPAGLRGLELLAGQALTWLLAGWVLVQLASSTWARNPGLADAQVAEAAKAFGLYLLVLLLAATRARLRAAVWALLASGSLLAVLGLIQVATGNFRDEYGGLARIKDAHIYGDVFEPRIAGPLGDPNYFAQILLMLVPLALALAWSSERGSEGATAGAGGSPGPELFGYRIPLRRKSLRKLLALGAAAVLVAATVLTYSRGGALALAVVLGLAFLLRGVTVREVLAGLAVLVLLIAFLPSGFTERLTTLEQVLPGNADGTLHPDSSFEKRRLVTRVAWEIFVERPLWGVGAANYTVHYDRHADRVGSAAREYDDPGEMHFPHNLYLEIGAETGLPGLIVFLAAVAVAFFYLRRARRRALARGDPVPAALTRGVALGLLGYLVSSLFLHGHFQRYLWLLLALAAALDALYREPRRGSETAAEPPRPAAPEGARESVPGGTS